MSPVWGPKPALLFGDAAPEIGCYPAPLVCKGSHPVYFHSATLGYTVEVRYDASAWSNMLVSNTTHLCSNTPCAENMQLLDLRCMIRSTFKAEVARVREAWRVHYNMSALPQTHVCARDLALMFRWVCDSFGDPTTTGRARV